MAFVTFNRLADAVEFLASHLDRNDIEAIAAQCADSAHDVEGAIPGVPPSNEDRIDAIRELGRRHARLSLRLRYWLRRFPSNSREFKLGGHNKGHVHVDFVRTEAAWQLKEIWICR